MQLRRLLAARIVVDDTPEAIVISGFDPVRREVARLSLQRLTQDGRIHPARIEDVVKEGAQANGGSHQGNRGANGD